MSKKKDEKSESLEIPKVIEDDPENVGEEDQDEPVSSAFTLHVEKSKIGVVPSITKLLNRKKILTSIELEKSNTISHATLQLDLQPVYKGHQHLKTTEDSSAPMIDQDPPPEPGILSVVTLSMSAPLKLEKGAPHFSTPQAKASSHSKDPAKALAPAAQKISGIQKTARRNKAKTEDLVAWSLQLLKNGTDPLGAGLSHLFEVAGAQSALFLSIEARVGMKCPHFVAKASIEATGSVWKGLTWDPLIFPEIWNVLLTKGFAQFEPGNRNVNRSAFNIDPNLWFTFIRVGTIERCRGIVLVVSSGSLSLVLSKTLPRFFEDPIKAAA